MLFKNYPEITYKIGNKEISLIDIFKNVAFTNTDNNLAFIDYYIQDGETPEIVSAKIYGTTEYSWLVLLVNNIADRHTEWFEDQATFLRNKELEYGGEAYYFSALPELQEGDIMVKVYYVNGLEVTGIDTNTYSVIKSFDPRYRVARGITGSGTIRSKDKVVFARKNKDGILDLINIPNPADSSETPENIQYATIQFVDLYENTVDYFYTNNNVIIDPYKKINDFTTSINSDTTYTNENDDTTANNFAKTVLYDYISTQGEVNGYFVRSVGKNLFDEYVKKQKIKVLKPEYLTKVIKGLEEALASNAVGTIFRVTV